MTTTTPKSTRRTILSNAFLSDAERALEVTGSTECTVADLLEETRR
jgi:hypothetical protein